jgi:hypothetical protein
MPMPMTRKRIWMRFDSPPHRSEPRNVITAESNVDSRCTADGASGSQTRMMHHSAAWTLTRPEDRIPRAIQATVGALLLRQKPTTVGSGGGITVRMVRDPRPRHCLDIRMSWATTRLRSLGRHLCAVAMSAMAGSTHRLRSAALGVVRSTNG